MHCYRQYISKQSKVLIVEYIITKYLDIFLLLLLPHRYLIKALCKLHLVSLHN